MGSGTFLVREILPKPNLKLNPNYGGQEYRIGTAKNVSGYRRHPRSVVAHSAEDVHRAAPIR